MVKIGIAGLGYMGRMHYRVWNQLEGIQVSAVCDANPHIRKEVSGRIGNIPGAAIDINFDDVALYYDFDRMLSEADMDALSITLPTHLHSEATQKALRAGYHVICEKPMALSLNECDTMIQAANETGMILQIGQCIRFWPEYTKARDIIESREYGELLAASFRRLGAPPDWGDQNWFENQDRSGGMPLDLHIHDTDFVQYLFGTPEAVTTTATLGSNKELLHMGTHYFYPWDIMVYAEGSWIMSDTFGFEMGFHIILEKASLVFNSPTDPTFTVFPESKKPYAPNLPAGDGYFREIEHFSRRLAGESTEEVVTPEESRESVRIVLAEVESARKQQRIRLS